MNRLMLFILLLIVAPLLSAQTGGPAPPTNLHAIQSPGSVPCVIISWTAGESSRLFKIYRSVDDTNHFSLVGFSPATIFADFDVVPLKMYAYAASVVDTLMQESARSSFASITVTGSTSNAKGVIAGTVKDDSSGEGIPHMRVRFFSLVDSIPWLHSALTDTAGHYGCLLDSGNYLIQTGPLLVGSSQPYASQWYKEAASPMTATAVAVNPGDTTDVDFTLMKVHASRLVSVQGKVLDDNGAALGGCSVAFLRSVQELQSLAAQTGTVPGLGDEFRLISGFGYAEGVLWAGVTDSQGVYSAQIAAGKPFLPIASREGYIPRYTEGTSDPTIAANMSVQSDTNTVDFSLPKVTAHTDNLQGATQGPGGQAITSRVILFPRPRGTVDAGVRSVGTTNAGVYLIENLVPAAYSLLAIPYSGYAPGYYRQGHPVVPHWEEGDSIVVSGSMTGFTMTLQPVISSGLGTVKGTIKSKENGLGLQGVIVSIWTSDGTAWGWSLSDENGLYEIDLVNAGPVTVSFDRPGYEGQDVGLNVQAGPSIQGLDAILSPSDPLSVRPPGELPADPQLYQNYPNPFNPTTTITYSLPRRCDVRLVVFDLLGREVRVLVDRPQAQGIHSIVFDALGLSSGTYFFQLRAGAYRATKSLTVVR